MAVLRDTPYGNFNFLVDLGTGDTESPLAGFNEVIRTEEVIWVGWASKSLDSDPRPEKVRMYVDEAVAEMLADFPPKP